MEAMEYTKWNMSVSSEIVLLKLDHINKDLKFLFFLSCMFLLFIFFTISSKKIFTVYMSVH